MIFKAFFKKIKAHEKNSQALILFIINPTGYGIGHELNFKILCLLQKLAYSVYPNVSKINCNSDNNLHKHRSLEYLVGINLFHLSVNKVFNSYGIFLNAY